MCDYDKHNELASEDVTDKYEISAGVRSRAEIEERINKMNNMIYPSDLATTLVTNAKLEALRWVLKEGDK